MLTPDEPAPFEVVNPDGRSGLFLTCDHASHRMPRALGTLGLRPEQIQEHIGWDIGAAQVARRLSSVLDAPLVLSGYSRLAIDCNRPLHVPSSIPTLTGGVRVPGNEGLADDEIRRRQEALFWPYHRAIEGLLARRPRPLALLSVHSFTPDFPGQVRPWPIAVVYGQDRLLAGLFHEELLREDPSLVVGDNEPYRVTPEGDYGIPNYGEKRGVPAMLLEIRQDGISTEEGAIAWADRVARAYRAVEPRLPRLVLQLYLGRLRSSALVVAFSRYRLVVSPPPRPSKHCLRVCSAPQYQPEQQVPNLRHRQRHERGGAN